MLSIMVSAPHRAPLDPALDAAALLRRLGFATLVLMIPVVALVSRRAAVVLAPLGIALLVLATLIDGAAPKLGPSVRRLLSSGLAACVGMLIAWAALSLLWSPFRDSAADKLGNIVGTAVLIVAGGLALPQRMRTSNLYLMAIGTGAAVFFSLGVAAGGSFDGVRGSPDGDGRSLERGLLILTLFSWPAIGWLASRDRRMEALVMGAGVLIAALIGAPPTVVGALIVGGLAFGAAAFSGKQAMRAIAALLGVLVVAAPAIPFMAIPLLRSIRGAASPIVREFEAWAVSIAADPLRLVTGHGLDSSFRERLTGSLPADAPFSVLFELWYDLGVVGVVAASAAVVLAVLRIARNGGPLAPAKLAAFTTAYTLAVFGTRTTQAWWLTVIGVVALAFLAAERGQFRTQRPKARLLSVANDR